MGKMFMFLIGMFIVVSLFGGILAGETLFARTRLTDAVSANVTTIPVASTTGFPTPGLVIIGDERIAYSKVTGTSFYGDITQPLIRGTGGSKAVAHSTGAKVSTLQGAMMNTAADYHIAVLADASGLQAFVSKPVATFQLIGSFIFLPLTFLGTDLQILTVFWGIFGAGTLIALFIALAGGRRV